jgi:hypothetical protein
MKSLLLFISATILLGSLFSQDIDPKHWNYYKVPLVAEDDNYKVTCSDIVARTVESKLRVVVENKTSDFLIFDEGGCAFKYDHGEYKSKSKKHIIKPHGKKGSTVKVTGTDKFHVDNYTFEFGGMSLAPENGTVHEAADYQLPVAVNEFEAGPFHVKCKGADLKTQGSQIYFIVTYNGDNIGFFNGSKLTLRIPSGTEYANDNKKLKNTLMEPGDKVKFTAAFNVPGKICDMQFATMHILWKDCFVESVASPIDGKTFEIEVDPGLTNGKN